MNPRERREAPVAMQADTHIVVAISHVILDPAPFDKIKKNSIKKVKKTEIGREYNERSTECGDLTIVYRIVE
jgi:hypothetical protein